MVSRLERSVFAGVVAVLALGAAGCSSGASQSSESATVDQVTVARILAAAPASCPRPRPQREQVSSRLAPLAGQRPVWAGFYARLDVETGTLHLPKDTPRTPNGWRIKTLWAVSDDERGVVKLRGRDIKTRAPVRFEVGEAAVSTVGVLDPANPGTATPKGEPKEFPSYLYFPASGCYELEASWPGGDWKMAIGVGR